MVINLYGQEHISRTGTARDIKRAYVFMSGAQRNRWTKQLFRGKTRCGRGRFEIGRG